MARLKPWELPHLERRSFHPKDYGLSIRCADVLSTISFRWNCGGFDVGMVAQKVMYDRSTSHWMLSGLDGSTIAYVAAPLHLNQTFTERVECGAPL